MLQSHLGSSRYLFLPPDLRHKARSHSPSMKCTAFILAAAAGHAAAAAISAPTKVAAPAVGDHTAQPAPESMPSLYRPEYPPMPPPHLQETARNAKHCLHHPEEMSATCQRIWRMIADVDRTDHIQTGSNDAAATSTAEPTHHQRRVLPLPPPPTHGRTRDQPLRGSEWWPHCAKHPEQHACRDFWAMVRRLDEIFHRLGNETAVEQVNVHLANQTASSNGTTASSNATATSASRHFPMPTHRYKPIPEPHWPMQTKRPLHLDCSRGICRRSTEDSSSLDRVEEHEGLGSESAAVQTASSDDAATSTTHSEMRPPWCRPGMRPGWCPRYPPMPTPQYPPMPLPEYPPGPIHNRSPEDSSPIDQVEGSEGRPSMSNSVHTEPKHEPGPNHDIDEHTWPQYPHRRCPREFHCICAAVLALYTRTQPSHHHHMHHRHQHHHHQRTT